MSNRAKIVAAVLACLLAAGCAREAGPEATALEYARALYASDPVQAYRLISTEDRKVKSKETFRREHSQPSGFAAEVTRQLASFIEATTTERTIRGERATVKLKLSLPNANAPEIASLVHGWDEERLNALTQSERTQITLRLDELRQSHKFPTLEGEETFKLVREGSGWRIFLNWAGGVRVRFRAAVREATSLQVTVSPEEILVTPGERFRVTVRAKNLSAWEVVTRVGHRIEPKAQADSLALVQCPLFLPVTITPGQTEEFPSVYVLLKDVPDGVKQFQVTYEFLPLARSRESEGKAR